MIKVSVIYPRSEGSEFNIGYYCDSHMPMVQKLLGDACTGIAAEEGLAGGVGSGFEVYIDLAENIDVAQETSRLEKEKAKLLAKQEQINRKLNNEEFLAKAPEKVVAKNRAELAEIDTKIEKIDKNLKALSAT